MIPRYSPPDVAASFADVQPLRHHARSRGSSAAGGIAKEGVLPAREVARAAFASTGGRREVRGRGRRT